MRKRLWRERIGYLLLGVGAALAALLMCACSDTGQFPRITTVTTIPGAADTALPKRIVFAADADGPEYLLDAAERFCRRANSISGGIFSLTLTQSEDPLADFKNGTADIVLLDGEAVMRLHAFFTIANEPFRYGSYEKFSITCNSDAVLRRLSEAAGANVFRAYYTGSDIFAGTLSLDEFLSVDRGAEPEPEEGEELDPDAPEWEARLFAAPGSTAWVTPNFPGVTVVEEADTRLRANALREADTLAELPSDAAENAATFLRIGSGDDSGLVITRSFHAIAPMWLILEPSLYEGLPDLGRAALEEAAAYMTGDIDNVCLEREKALLGELADEGVEISGGFASTRSRLYRAESARLSELSADEREFRELLGRFR